MPDEPVQLTLVKLARSNKADHIPRVGAIVSLMVGVAVWLWCEIFMDAGIVVSALAGLGGVAIGLGLFVALGWPIVRHRHREVMKERTHFFFPHADPKTATAMRELAMLQKDVTADPAFRKLYEFINSLPDYQKYLDPSFWSDQDAMVAKARMANEKERQEREEQRKGIIDVSKINRTQAAPSIDAEDLQSAGRSGAHARADMTIAAPAAPDLELGPGASQSQSQLTADLTGPQVPLDLGQDDSDQTDGESGADRLAAKLREASKRRSR